MTQTVAGEPQAHGFLDLLASVYLSPRETFERIVARPWFGVPLAALVLLNVGFTAVWIAKVDIPTFFQSQLEEREVWDRLDAEQRHDILEKQTKFMRFAWATNLVTVPLATAAIGLLLLVVYRVFYGADVTLPQSMAIVTFASLAVALAQRPLALLTLVLKGDWNVDPETALQSSLGLIVDSGKSGGLHALAASVDLFNLWFVFLLAAGFGAASRRSTGAALAGVGACWGVLVLLKTAWAAFAG